MQGRFKRDSGAASDPEQQPGGTTFGSAQAAGGSGGATQGAAAATGRTSTPSGIEAGRIIGLDGKPGSRMAMRNWRISTRLVSLLALPVVASATLGGLRINSSLDNISQLEHMKTLTDITEHATDLAAALQEERDSSAGPLAAGNPTNDAIASARQVTDRENKLYQAAADNVSGEDTTFSGLRATLLSIGAQLQRLSEIRHNAYSGGTSITQTVSEYDGLVSSLLNLSQDMAQATNNPQMIRATRSLAAFSQAKEFESIQRAIISAALAQGGRLNLNDYQSLWWAYTNEGTALNKFQNIYGPDSAQLLTPIDKGGNDTITAHDTLRVRIAASPTAISNVHLSYLDWDDAAKTKLLAMSQIERSLLNQMQQRALSLQNEAKQSALISGAIILLVLGVAVVGAFVVARSMIRSLRRLQETAQDVAQKRLPELVKQLSETDPQDVDSSVQSIGINTRDEIGQVARAFDEVHSEAVRLAAEQALLRGNVNAMFTNLSRRSQGLIQRQLSLISELESREADPDQLSSLFKLDHLATRMRRNGENLLVLAGEEPGRRWTRPVPLVDVLRAAASEVEQYERIELTSVPSTEVTGRIVNDLVHLLAELLENATSFSSPQTKVRVTGHALPDGRVLIEIHDTGIGLSPEDLADINERLANPPTVDVSVSRRMGLFVVGRLSLRHGIRIQLRPSDSGGTTALVMLPVDVTQGGASPKNSGRPASAPPAQQGSGIAGAFGNRPVGAAPQRGQVAGGAARPALNPAAGRPGGAPQQPGQPGQPGSTPRWAAAQDAPQGFPEDDRALMDTPRGHEEIEAAPAFDPFSGQPAQGPRAGFPQQAPADPFGGRPQGAPGGQFPPPQPQSTGPGGFRSDVFGGRPGPASRQNAGPGDTAEFPAVRDDEFAPGGPAAQPGGEQFPGQGMPRPGAPGYGRHADHGGQQPYGADPFAVPGPGGQGSGPNSMNGAGAMNGQAGPAGRYPQPGQDPQGGFGVADTGQFPPVQQPAGPGDTAQFPAVRAEETGQFPASLPPAPFQDGSLPRRGPRGPQGTPGWNPAADGAPAEGGQDRFDAGRRLGGGPADPAAERQPAPAPSPARPEPQLPTPAEPMALPPAPARGDEPTPIFSSIESDWFRTGQAERMQQIHVDQGTRGGQAPPARPAGRTAPPQRPRTERPGARPGTAQAAAAAPAGSGAQPLPRETPNWRTSPNDALRQRAEQIREPAAGGVTPSGLPRRVPRANLVAGGAAQPQAPQGGPQVSRAPDDVRGRLTNLRRGIQQGREAGGHTDGRGFSTNHQER